MRWGAVSHAQITFLQVAGKRCLPYREDAFCQRSPIMKTRRESVHQRKKSHHRRQTCRTLQFPHRGSDG
jgi:hypothetical protein